MGTEIIDFDDSEREKINITLKRYWGGVRGTMFNLSKKYSLGMGIDFSYRAMYYIIYKVLKQDYDELSEKDTLYDGHIRYLRALKPLLDILKERFDFEEDE